MPSNIVSKKFLNNNKKISILIFVLFFISFRIIGSNESDHIDQNIKILLRNEFNSANSYALAKSILDIERIGQFECSKLVELSESNRVFIDNSISKKCQKLIDIFKSTSKIESLSGVTYELTYYHKLNFYLATLEILTYLIIVLLSIFTPKFINQIIEIENIKHSAIQEKLENQKEKFALSQKLAHDIRSPISTLNLISSKIENEDIKYLQLAVVNQINAIANDLLNDVKESQQQSTTEKTTHELEMMFKNLEKEYQFKTKAIKQKIIFKINYAEIKKRTFESKLTSIIYRNINNFIQNAIEATDENGIINISTNTNNDGYFEIIVSDNGKGIPLNIINRLGNEIMSHGKNNSQQSGNGIALYNAKKELSEYDIELIIASELNKGTTIKIIST